MIICVCAVLREEQLREMAKTMTQYEIEQETGACQQCNSCVSTVKQIVNEVRSED